MSTIPHSDCPFPALQLLAVPSRRFRALRSLLQCTVAGSNLAAGCQPILVNQRQSLLRQTLPTTFMCFLSLPFHCIFKSQWSQFLGFFSTYAPANHSPTVSTCLSWQANGNTSKSNLAGQSYNKAILAMQKLAMAILAR